MVEAIRFSGLASGMDTQSIIDSLMKAERLPLNKINQNKQQLEWKRDDYRSMNLLLSELDTFVFDGIFKKSKMVQRSVTSSNTEFVTATASADAANVSYKIDKVKLATAARQQSTVGVSGTTPDKIDPTKSLWSQQNKFGQTKKTITVPDSGPINIGTSFVYVADTITVGTENYSLRTSEITTENPLKENEFLINENGDLTFGKTLSPGETFDVSYTPQQTLPWKKEKASDTFTVPKDGGSEFQLSKTAFSLEKNVSETEVPDYQSVSSITVGTKTYNVRTAPITEAAPLQSGEVFIDESTGKIKFGEKLAGGQSFTVDYTNHYLEYDVKTYDENGEAQYKNFKIDGSNSLNSMFSTINRGNAGVNLFYDEGTDKVVAMRSETGEFNPNGQEIEFVNVTRDEEGNVTEVGPNTLFTSVFGLGADVAGTGTDAEFTINGLETNRKSNVFTLNGVTFTLKKDSMQADGTDSKESATINIQTDTDAIVKTVTEFVDKYNEILGKINDKISEEKFSSYKPLTSEEKEALSEDEIEKWEEKAKSGMLRRDSILSGALDKMRSTLYGKVVSNDVTLTGDYTHLTTIGITTTNNYMDRGKLEIDEEKLRAAIADNPDSVYQLFMADGEGDGEKGIARRLRDTIGGTIDSIEERAGNSYKTAHSYTMGKQLLDFEDQIKRFEDRLAQTEDRYWKQYNAMEKAIQQLNNQSSTLMSYLGTGTQG